VGFALPSPFLGSHSSHSPLPLGCVFWVVLGSMHRSPIDSLDAARCITCGDVNPDCFMGLFFSPLVSGGLGYRNLLQAWARLGPLSLFRAFRPVTDRRLIATVPPRSLTQWGGMAVSRLDGRGFSLSDRLQRLAFRRATALARVSGYDPADSRTRS
jgi:hypothetical protein